MTLPVYPLTAVCSYGDGNTTVTFDSLISTELKMSGVKSRCGRTYTGWKYVLSVRGYINADAGTDTLMTTYRNTLSRPAGLLTFKNKGAGSLIINDHANGDVRDNSFGPWPEIISWKPVGNHLTALVHWTVTTTIPASSAYHYAQGIEECWYTIGYDVDAHGYSTINIEGGITIPMTRKTTLDPALPDNADSRLDKIIPACQPKFRRKTKSRRLSEDKRTLTFHFVDEEMKTVPPYFCSDWDVRHRSGSTAKQGFFNWPGTITATIWTPPGIPRQVALVKFLSFCANRLGLGAANQMQWVHNAGGLAGTIMIESLDIDEHVTGNDCNFSLGYRILGCQISEFINASGMFKDPNSDYTQWKQSVSAIFDPQGFAQLEHRADDDVIVGLLDSQKPVISSGDVSPFPARREDVRPAGIGNQKAKTDSSWIYFMNRVAFSEDARLAVHVPLLGASVPGNAPLVTIGKQISDVISGISPMLGTKVANIIQRVGPSTRRVRMWGRASRVGLEITPPEIKTVGGVVPTLEKRHAHCEPTGRVGSEKIFSAVWDLHYVVAAVGGHVPVGANPSLGIEGQP